jgi:hypothetical protein
MLHWMFTLGVRKAKINEYIAKLNSAGCGTQELASSADAMRTALLSFTAGSKLFGRDSTSKRLAKLKLVAQSRAMVSLFSFWIPAETLFHLPERKI